jgi:hypothetical protein
MHIDRQGIEDHARRRLQGEADPADAGGRLSHFKRFL